MLDLYKSVEMVLMIDSKIVAVQSQKSREEFACALLVLWL